MNTGNSFKKTIVVSGNPRLSRDEKNIVTTGIKEFLPSPDSLDLQPGWFSFAHVHEVPVRISDVSLSIAPAKIPVFTLKQAEVPHPFHAQYM